MGGSSVWNKELCVLPNDQPTFIVKVYNVYIGGKSRALDLLHIWPLDFLVIDKWTYNFLKRFLTQPITRYKNIMTDTS